MATQSSSSPEKDMRGGHNKTHGLGGTPICDVWGAMTSRCYREHNPAYKNYGGRGIKICEFLRASPANIILLIGKIPARFTIDRINNDGNYSCGQCAECLKKKWPLNIRWASRIQQSRNNRKCHYVRIEGISHCVSEWCEIKGIKYKTAKHRIQAGWPEKNWFDPPYIHGHRP
jgi:hypothetical protein